jgi:hypothetical protein
MLQEVISLMKKQAEHLRVLATHARASAAQFPLQSDRLQVIRYAEQLEQRAAELELRQPAR